jgi:hypothetical protein
MVSKNGTKGNSESTKTVQTQVYLGNGTKGEFGMFITRETEGKHKDDIRIQWYQEMEQKSI